MLINQLGKAFESFTKQSLYKKELLESIEEVKEHVAKVKEEANLRSQWRSYRTEKQLQENKNILQAMYEMLHANPMLTHPPPDLNYQSPFQHRIRAAMTVEESSLPATPIQDSPNMSATRVSELLNLLRSHTETAVASFWARWAKKESWQISRFWEILTGIASRS